MTRGHPTKSAKTRPLHKLYSGINGNITSYFYSDTIIQTLES